MEQPNYGFIKAIIEGPDRQVDPVLKDLLRNLDGKPLDEFRAGLHKALDYAARGSLSSDFVVSLMDLEWKRLGGNVNDPAPWRDQW